MFFDPQVLPSLVAAGDGNNVAVSPCGTRADGTVVLLDEANAVTAVLMGRERKSIGAAAMYKTVNVYLFRHQFLRELFLPYLAAYIETKSFDEYYEVVLSVLVRLHLLKGRLTGVVVPPERWAEIDTPEDLRRADFRFSPPERRYDILTRLHGWFQDYGCVDHHYLYNLYFPPPELIEDFRRHLPDLLTQYPSGQWSLDEVLSHWLRLPADWLAVGNGASELIKAVLGGWPVVLSTPGFNEYEACAGEVRAVPLDPETWDFDPVAFAAAAAGRRSRWS